SVGAVWFDYQEDCDLDLLVANMDGDANGLFRNDGGIFTDVAAEAGIADGGRGLENPSHGTVRPCVGDFDADGDLDIFFANYGPNGLFRNDGERKWRNVAPELGLAVDGRYDACVFGDMDNDGRVDLFVNGTVTGGVQYRDYLLRNTPDGFVDLTPEELLSLDADHGAQWVDFDGDGALDLSLAGVTDTGMHFLLRSLMPRERRGRSIQVQVLDPKGRATRAGAEIRVYAAGTRTLLGTGQVDTGSGYDTQSVLPVFIGLPGPGKVDIEVSFPGGGARVTTVVRGVDPRSQGGRPVVVPVGRGDF
ncbi:MAG: CRTAC1 family protein, partial [Longimicrobiales bacterium]